MYAGIVLDAGTWAQRTFGMAMLGDVRRTRRLVALAACMMRRPDASLCAQTRSWAARKAAAELLIKPTLTHRTVSTPHWQQTRRAAGVVPVVLLVQDTTELDLRHFPTMRGTGPLGDGRGRGMLLQSVLALTPDPRQVLGLAYTEPFVRQPAPLGETPAQRRRRPKETDVWDRAVVQIGPPPAGCRWVHVGDRGADSFALLTTCRRQGTDFVVRAAQDRSALQDTTQTHVLTAARALPAQDSRPVCLPARPGQPARTALVQVSWTPLTVRPPRDTSGQAPLPLWVVRVWETGSPLAARAPLEWVLLTSVPVTAAADAWERVAWYQARWLVEDYHMCLKTGCRIEHRRLADTTRLATLLGIVAPIAARLVQLRELARLAPQQPAPAAVGDEVVRVVTALAHLPPGPVTVGAFWRAVARLGGYLDRPRDGPPGWQTLWRGWCEVQTVLEGVHLAARCPPD